ncbi:unnamed protein product [Prorocentrum cordatum]|uniref:Fe2OG dioxygenase domain-containing protein n=1 Tax=Prorocentrum cordatum TaxID=2364126 RepID=A0ABN9S9X6_9DINO|nr:unnamed protein product [Polarella glacialis]
MQLRRVSLPALADGCVSEAQRLRDALCGPGFFACDGAAGFAAACTAVPADSSQSSAVASRARIGPCGGVLQEAYRASRQLHAAEAALGEAARWTQRKPLDAPRRWWFTVAAGRGLPECEEYPGVAAALRAADALFAAPAGALAEAAAAALGLPAGALRGAAAAAMLRGLRYRPTDGHGLGISEHVDFGDFTLCHGDGPGLEARAVEAGVQRWLALPPGQLLFLAGPGLEKKSAGAVRAVRHRVAAGAAERFSFCRLHRPSGAALGLWLASPPGPLGDGKAERSVVTSPLQSLLHGSALERTSLPGPTISDGRFCSLGGTAEAPPRPVGDAGSCV